MTSGTRPILILLMVFILLFVLLDFIIELFGFPRFMFTETFFAKLKHITILSIIPLNFISACLGYILARRRNRLPIQWAILCFVFSFWGLLYLYFLSRNRISLDAHVIRDK
jgi:hypothetical protein